MPVAILGRVFSPQRVADLACVGPNVNLGSAELGTGDGRADYLIRVVGNIVERRVVGGPEAGV